MAPLHPGLDSIARDSVTQLEAIAAELAAEAIEHPKHLEQWDRSLVAVVVVVARRRPGLAAQAAAVVRAILEDQRTGEIIEMEQTNSGSWRAAS